MAAILVTGAGGGIGHELVAQLARRGDTLFAAQRDGETLDAIEGSVHAIRMDVGEDRSVRDGFAEIDRLLAGATLDAVVNCAAIAPLGVVELLPLDIFAQVLNTNTMGSLRVMQQAIPRLRGHGGKLLLVTSLWGRVAGPMVGAYAASKHAVEALADAMRRETAAANFHLVVVEPGVVRTKMLDSQLAGSRALGEGLGDQDAGRYVTLYQRYAALVEKGARNALIARDAAAQMVRILDTASPRPRYRLGQDAKLVCLLAKLLPDRAMDRVFRALLG